MPEKYGQAPCRGGDGGGDSGFVVFVVVVVKTRISAAAAREIENDAFSGSRGNAPLWRMPRPAVAAQRRRLPCIWLLTDRL